MIFSVGFSGSPKKRIPPNAPNVGINLFQSHSAHMGSQNKKKTVLNFWLVVVSLNQLIEQNDATSRQMGKTHFPKFPWVKMLLEKFLDMFTNCIVTPKLPPKICKNFLDNLTNHYNFATPHSPTLIYYAMRHQKKRQHNFLAPQRTESLDATSWNKSCSHPTIRQGKQVKMSFAFRRFDLNEGCFYSETILLSCKRWLCETNRTVVYTVKLVGLSHLITFA